MSHTAKVLWRAIAEEVASNRTRTIKNKSATRTINWGGRRMAERAVDFLFRAVAFASHKDHQPPKPPKKWMTTLRAEWTKKIGGNKRRAKLTHSEEEVRTMFAGLDKADPRLHLMLELGAEARLGQVARCMRSALTLEGGALDCGRLEILGDEDKKRGTEVDLTELQHHLVAEVLATGYLSELERHFIAGDIDDYPLFPGTRLKKGISQARVGRDPDGRVVLLHPKQSQMTGFVGGFKRLSKYSEFRTCTAAAGTA